MLVYRNCLFCDNRFAAKLERRLFCSDVCRVRYNREERLRCFYCGELATTRDHIFPQRFRAVKGFEGQETVNCCRECNSLMGPSEPLSAENRIRVLLAALVRKYKLDRPVPEWEDEEIE